jgi:hypothetical protein
MDGRTPLEPLEPLALILDPLRRGEGLRHLWLGDSRQGKTTANRILVNQVLKERLVSNILTIDEKNPATPEYSGTYRINPEHLRNSPPINDKEASHIVFRGIAYRRNLTDAVNPVEVAEMGWDLIRLTPSKIMLNFDELADATNGYQAWQDDIIPQVYRKGGGIGLSITATTQMPQLLPREAFGLSETIGLFRMDGREAKYLVDYRVLSKDAADIVPSLQVGEWILYKKGAEGWNGKTYRFRR